tara:strand:+ start:56 stop:778 length:723 start_codon:yes stop_codon:yes gene_type:complete
MNKIITTIALLAFTSVSANAIDFERFSITGGLASNQSIWGATAKQDDFNAAGTSIEETDKESGVFTDGYASQFIELGIGKYFSIGYEHTPDAISTPENINDGGGTGGGSAGETTSKVSVDFNDFNTTYAKLNLPFLGGAYIKAGTVSTDLDIKETQLSGNTYNNVSIDGTSFGAGYAKQLGGSGFDLRFEGNYVELDGVTVNNGVTKTAGTGINNFKEIKASNLEGLTGKIALTYTFGRN